MMNHTTQSKYQPPQRDFCAGGPMPREGAYVLRNRPEISAILDKIQKGRYFVIYAARQVGKTSLIQEVVEALEPDETYLALYLQFQGLSPNLGEEQFYRYFARRLLRETAVRLKYKAIKTLQIQGDTCDSPIQLIHLLEEIAGQIPYRLCIFIDEFEGIPQTILDGFLQTLRGIYLSKQTDPTYNILHSVSVIGVHSISQMTFARTSSPFNVHESVEIANFTRAQVRHLLTQYSDETGDCFPDDVMDFIADKTGGQPYLVNLVAKILVTEIKPYTDERSVTLPDAEAAYMKMLNMRGNTNLDSIRRRIQSAAHRERLMAILTQGNIRYNLNDPILEELITFGVISDQGGYCGISNPAYAHTVITSYLPWRNGSTEEYFPNGYQQVIDSKGFINLHAVIEQFQYFLPKVDPAFYFPNQTPVEIVPHYFLFSQLEVLCAYTGGHVRTEVHQGSKRMDVVLFEKEGRQQVIECKIWRGPAYQQEGREQLVDYLAHEGLADGYLVFFAHAKKASYTFNPVDAGGKRLYEYIIPLPEKLSPQHK